MAMKPMRRSRETSSAAAIRCGSKAENGRSRVFQPPPVVKRARQDCHGRILSGVHGLAAHAKTNAFAGARIKCTAVGTQIERCLDESAVVLESDIPRGPQACSSVNSFVGYRGFGDPTHHAITYSAPPACPCSR